MKISVKECADTLKEKDNILILTHANPDGDTLGSGFALCRALMKIGKICAVINADDIPKKYNYLFDDIVEIKFKPMLQQLSFWEALRSNTRLICVLTIIQPIRSMQIYYFLRMLLRLAKLCMRLCLLSV